MKVRRYEGRTYRDALAQVRDDLGPDAVILTTKELARGGLFGLFSRGAVEIVAAADLPPATLPTASRRATDRLPGKPTAPAEGRAAPRRGPATYTRAAAQSVRRASGAAAQPVPAGPPSAGPLAGGEAAVAAAADPATATPADDRLDRLENTLAEMKATLDLVAVRDSGTAALVERNVPVRLLPRLRQLTARGVTEDCAAALLRGVADAVPDASAAESEMDKALRERVAAAFAVSGPLLRNNQRGARIVAMIGPTGVGKTTTIAKLAAQHALMEDRRVGLLTVDTYRVAAVDQLRTFADIMRIPVKVASTPEEARSRLSALGGRDLVLVDTAGRSQNAEQRVRELGELMQALEPDEIHLVVSATTKAEDMVAIVREFGKLGANRLVFTKIDETSVYGPLLTAAHVAGLPVSYLATGQKVPEDLEVAVTERLVDLVLGSLEAGHR